MNKYANMLDNMDKILSMTYFEEDWNNNGAQPFSDEAIERFREVVRGLTLQPWIAPTGRGSLLMQYEKDDLSILAFEVFADKVGMVHIPKGDMSKADIDTIRGDVISEIERISKDFYGLD